MSSRFILGPDNIPRLNPAWASPNVPSAPPMPETTQQPLAVPTMVADIVAFNEQFPDRPMRMAPETGGAMLAAQAAQGALFDGLSAAMAAYEIPLGMLGNLNASTERFKDFFVDDSGSMCTMDGELNDGSCCTRWQECEERITTMLDILAHLPCPGIRIQFFNRRTIVNLAHGDGGPDEFKAVAHREIRKAFATPPSGSTPLLAKLLRIFADASARPQKTFLYVFNDGAPDEDKASICRAILTRDAECVHMNLMSVSGRPGDTQWMKDVEEMSMVNGAPSFLGEYDDFKSEREEVLHDQGSGFPYTYGSWLVGCLCGASFPETLDAMDEGVPFTRKTMQEICGRTMTPEEYGQVYFTRFMQNERKTPDENAACFRLWHHLYSQFARDDITSHQISEVTAYLRSKQIV